MDFMDMLDKKEDNICCLYKKDYSILLVIKDKELYISSKFLKLGFICRHILNDSYCLGIILRMHSCRKNRMLCLYLGEGYYSPIAALSIIKMIERYVPENVLIQNENKINFYRRYFKKQVVLNLFAGLKGLLFNLGKNQSVILDTNKEKLKKNRVCFIDKEMNCEKYIFSSESRNHTYSLMLRKLMSIYSNIEYGSIFDFNDVCIDAKYKYLFVRFWEERNAKIERID